MTPNGENRAIVLLSGGQDSCTCLAWAQKAFQSVTALSIRYGQRHAIELRMAAHFASNLAVPIELLMIDPVGALLDSALVNPQRPVAESGGLGGLPSTFTPGRNLLFLTLASSIAVCRGIGNVVIGASQTDYSGYPDCREVFVKSFQDTFGLAVGVDQAVTVHAPLMHKSKADTFELADELGVLEAVIANTMTCYHGIVRLHDWGRGCGDCPACKLRRQGYWEWRERQAAATAVSNG